MSSFFQKFFQLEPLLTYPLLLLLILVILLLIKGFLEKENSEKIINLISSVSLFALVWGFFTLMISLIGAFEAIQMANEISAGVIAGGLQYGLLTPVFGSVIFLIGRLGIIVLTWTKK
ncbi:hypothetical protein FF125_21155 [Aureibaculum algae]|uniref:MotA/TolQ/ExbB proton channel domain-containing protein n=1 Tax=Aureibaculum algae TaxID=2584122 RepID=A0A5B7U1D3_9FLAO|nr:hypothetical protein [Aureibaculum algae]QCX40827.1 hypothetical protein FF125_21155 [Aureibaculum algae]